MKIAYTGYSLKAGRTMIVKHKKHTTERSVIRMLYMMFDGTTLITCHGKNKGRWSVLDKNRLEVFFNDPNKQ